MARKIKSAAQKAHEICRHHDRHFEGRKCLDPAANPQERTLHAVAHHQQTHAQQKRPCAAQYLKHLTNPLTRSAPSLTAIPRGVTPPNDIQAFICVFGKSSDASP